MQHGKDEFDKQYFGIFFKKYDYSELMFYQRWFKGWLHFLDRHLSLKDGQNRSVLEVGCAIGAFAKLLKERGFKVVAVDISEYIIKKAKKLQTNIEFKVSNIEDKVDPKEQFDYIFAFEILEHLQQPKKALYNMKQLLKKNGVLVFSTPEPSQQTLADPMHINVHFPKYWLSLGKELRFKKVYCKPAAFIPFLYRFHSFFSVGFPFRIDLPFINNTNFYFFEK